jgi:hypothetical protein
MPLISSRTSVWSGTDEFSCIPLELVCDSTRLQDTVLLDFFLENELLVIAEKSNPSQRSVCRIHHELLIHHGITG